MADGATYSRLSAVSAALAMITALGLPFKPSNAYGQADDPFKKEQQAAKAALEEAIPNSLAVRTDGPV